MAEDSSFSPNLRALRSAIDAVDRELLEFINRRAELARAICKIEQQAPKPCRPTNAAHVIEQLQSTNDGPIPPEGIASIWHQITSACSELETPFRIAYLGPAGTYTEEAALAHFGAAVVRVPCVTLDEVFRVTTARAADFGVVPIENSTEGMVARSLDQFLTTPLTQIAEISLEIRHNLLRKVDELAGISAVCAHPQALAQCHAWLSANLPDAQRIPVASNAEGARRASLDAVLGAIASVRAGAQWRLRVVCPAIQDDANNRTRFAVLAHPSSQAAPRPTGHDRTSLIATVTNRPGALHDMLMPLKKHGVSMTRFESRPARSGQWEYYFYLDLEGHVDDPNVRDALIELRNACGFFKILGSYAAYVG